MMNQNEFPILSLHTTEADFDLYLDGSLSIGDTHLEPETVNQLVSFLAKPGVAQLLSDTAVKRACDSQLLDFTEAKRDIEDMEGAA